MFLGDLAGIFAQLLRQHFGIVAANLKRDDRTDVSLNGSGRLLIELSEVLMGDNQAQPE